MTNHIKKIEELQKKVQESKDELIRLNEQKKINKEEKIKVLAELKEAGVTEDNIESIIEEKNKTLTEKINKIEETLNDPS